MKRKFLLLSIFLCLFLLFGGCKTQDTLSPFVSELRLNCYHSENSDFDISAGYGFIEVNKDFDGKKGQTTYVLNFRLNHVQNDMTTYNLALSFNDKEYKSTFKLNPISHNLTALIPVENFNLNEFNITLTYGSNIENIKMKSTLPKGTISYTKALSCLQNSQSKLLKTYYDTNGNFNAEITLRVLVLDNHSYWYVGLSNSNGTKALLLDGLTGKVLAVKDIF
mgnify:CR=1 FL=1